MRETFEHQHQLEGQQSRFAECVAIAVAFLMPGEFDLEWLQAFLRGATSETRRSFADQVGGFLRNLEPDAADQAWQGWVAEYVDARLSGKPPLDEDEWVSMQRWFMHLGATFPEAASRVVARTPQIRDHTLLLYELQGMEPPPGPPSALARFLLHLLKGQRRLYESDYVLEICRQMGSLDDQELMRALQERFLELGGSGALFSGIL